MNMLAELPVAGQWTVLGVLVGMIAYVIIALIRGDLVTRKHVDQETKRADSWQEAWSTAMQVQEKTVTVAEQSTALVTRLEPLVDTLKHVLESLPVVEPEQGDKK